MNTKIWISAAVIFATTAFAWRFWGGAAVAAGGGALLMWLLLHYTRMMKVMERAAQTPIGTVDSAVMLNAKLAKGMTLLNTIGLTRSLGQADASQTPESPQATDVFVWADASGDSVTVAFSRGKVQHWQLTRAQRDT